MVHDQINRHQGLNALGIFAEVFGDIAHSGKVGKQRHTGEVLQHNAGKNEWNLINSLSIGGPVR